MNDEYIYFCDMLGHHKRPNTCEKSELYDLVKRTNKPIIHRGWAIACGQAFEEVVPLNIFRESYLESYWTTLIEVEETDTKIMVKKQKLD